ncbi:MAG: hypothetical protein JXB30_04665 [Anaerolineae bacterium]|nr:hypothetical protein [Anaerolineae bacterium]
MVDSLFIVPLQIFFYDLSTSFCEFVWGAARAMLLGGYLVQWFASWLKTALFGPSISGVAAISLDASEHGILGIFATFAVFLLAFSYLLSPFVHIRVVDWKKALMWFLLALLFFQIGPELYTDVEDARRGLSSVFYDIVFPQIENANGAAPGLEPLSDIGNSPTDVTLNPLVNHFKPYIPDDHYEDGLDIAMAYTLSNAEDVLFAPENLPVNSGESLNFKDEYFPELDDTSWLSYESDDRIGFITDAWAGIFRLLLSFFFIIFGLLEQLIYLCLTIATGILFIDLAIALPFALFERTELMARSVLDMILELFIFSAIVAMLQAVVMGIVFTAAGTQSPTLAFGAAAIGLLFETVFLIRAWGAITDALSRMFKAMSQVVGGQVMAPSDLAMAGATMAGTAALGIATGGASLAASGIGAATTLASTGSMATAAGSAMAGSDKLFHTATMGQRMLPEGSALKEKLGQFQEGTIAQRMMPGLGGALLLGGDKKESAAGGQMDVRFDAADTSQLRDSLLTAMTAAVRHAPSGGYTNQSQALSAITDILKALGRDPSKDPAMGAYLGQRQGGAVHFVMSLTQQARHGSGAPLSPDGETSSKRLPSLGAPQSPSSPQAKSSEKER